MERRHRARATGGRPMKRAIYTNRPNDTDWARGCVNCKFGIAAAADMTGAVEFYLERIANHVRGEIEFCTCRAGVAYEANLRNHYQAMAENDTAHPLPFAQLKGAPVSILPREIGDAIRCVDQARAKTLPTIHAEAVS